MTATAPGPFDRFTAGRPASARRWDVALVIAAGGALGGSMRYALGLALPSDPGQLPMSTLVENLLGSFLMGVLMVLVVDVWPPSRYRRPFLGVGLLGGFTTFSAFTNETRALLELGAIGTATGYAVASMLGALVAVWVGARTTRRLVDRPRPHGSVG